MELMSSGTLLSREGSNVSLERLNRTAGGWRSQLQPQPQSCLDYNCKHKHWLAGVLAAKINVIGKNLRLGGQIPLDTDDLRAHERD